MDSFEEFFTGAPEWLGTDLIPLGSELTMEFFDAIDEASELQDILGPNDFRRDMTQKTADRIRELHRRLPEGGAAEYLHWLYTELALQAEKWAQAIDDRRITDWDRSRSGARGTLRTEAC